MLNRDAKALCGSVAIHALLLLLLFLQMPSWIRPFPWPIGARVLNRAGAQLHCRFRPARDRLGRPIASLVTFTYEWRILSEEPSFLSSP